jgi:hypothetical protein
MSNEENNKKKKSSFLSRVLPGRRGKQDAPKINELNKVANPAPAPGQAANLVSADAVNDAAAKGRNEEYIKPMNKGNNNIAAGKNGAGNNKAVPKLDDATTPVVGADIDAGGADKIPKARGRNNGGDRRHRKNRVLAPIVPYSKEEIAETKKGMSPFVSTLVAGGILMSVYVVGKAAYKWFTTRRNAKKKEPTKRDYNIDQE